MIRTFRDQVTADLFNGESNARVRRVPTDVRDRAVEMLDQLHNAATLSDMAVPPGNRLEVLKGGLAGFHSVRVNRQWRIIFRWSDGGPGDVSLVDYHG
ncbi:type II toxin-antitoxin system RelE/ParE family toxin [Myxococcota bacterium]|nr:type II toxin-antitoxin system RelE/ParE family toxin [Myxococcota bacterium]